MFQVFKEVWINSEVVGLRRAIRKFGVDRFKKNCILATDGFEWVLRKMFGSPPASPGNSGVKKLETSPRLAHVPAYSKLEQ